MPYLTLLCLDCLINEHVPYLNMSYFTMTCCINEHLTLSYHASPYHILPYFTITCLINEHLPSLQYLHCVIYSTTLLTFCLVFHPDGWAGKSRIQRQQCCFRWNNLLLSILRIRKDGLRPLGAGRISSENRCQEKGSAVCRCFEADKLPEYLCVRLHV